jgi:hypothetical protein
MNRQALKYGRATFLAIAAAFVAIWSLPSGAQVPVDESGNALGAETLSDGTLYSAPPPLSDAELAELVGPVALYPDDLLAIVLPASTYPLEIVQAARFLEQYEQDSSLKPDEEWDESVTALLNYPEVLRMMDEDIDWTWQLGDAVVTQQADVIAAVESFRDRAYAAGNLKSDKYQTVNNDGGIIEIVPIDDEVIYVPYYEPERVLVRQVTPVYYYYPRPYPVYYYPYAPGYSFYNGYFWGVTTAYRIGWSSHNLHVHHYSYWGHPYYGHSYYGHYYRRPSVTIYNTWYVNNSSRHVSNRYRDGDYRRPRHNGGARPGYVDQRTRSYRARDVSRQNSQTVARTYSTATQGAGSDRRSHYSSRDAVSRDSSTSGRTAVRSTGNTGTARQERDQTIRFRERPETREANRANSQDRPSRSAQSESLDRQRTRPVTTTTNGNATQRAATERNQQARSAVRQSREAPVRVQATAPNRDDRVARATAQRDTARAQERSAPRQESAQAPRQESRESGNQRRETAAQNRREAPADNRQARSSARESTRQSRARN